jgi:CRISPR-associated protein Cas1
VALALFNLKVLKEEDFYVHEPPQLPLPKPERDELDAVAQERLGAMSETEDSEELFDMPDQQMEVAPDEIAGRRGRGAMRLHPAAFRKVVTAFEKKLQTEFHHPRSALRMTYAEALVEQARQFRQLIEGQAALYQPLLLR